MDPLSASFREKTTFLAPALLAAALVAACGAESGDFERLCLLCPGDGTPPPTDEWSISPAPELVLHDTVQFRATLRYAYGGFGEGPFTWTSRDSVLLPMDSGLAVGGAPGRTSVEVVHVPDGKASLFRFTVVLGDAPTEAVRFASLGGPCGTDLQGTAHCWGDGTVMGLGYQSGSRSTATPVAGDHAFTAVGAATVHSCGLTGEGRTFCWGDIVDNSLGISSDGLSPTEVGGAPLFASLHVGSGEICGITAGGDAYCWGRTPSGRLDEPTRFGDAIAWVDLAPGDGEHSCGVDDQGVSYCWGHSCGLDAGGIAYCWGANGRGQLGDGTRSDRAEPAPVAGDRQFRDIAILPGGFSCAIDQAGQLHCWGLAPWADEPWLEPTPVASTAPFQELSASRSMMCGLDTGGTPHCWGAVWTDAIQPGGWSPTTLVTEPTAVATDLAFSSLSAADGFACGLTPEGIGYCWGRNEAGQLGTGTFRSTTSPDQPVVRLR